MISNLIPEKNSRHFLILLIFAAVMLLLRTIPVYEYIFTNWPTDYGFFVHSSADSPYHMRMVLNTIGYFPRSILFDPFLNFPTGYYINTGPMFQLIIAAASLIIGLGKPSIQLINNVGAYSIAVIGALCIIPLYFTARGIFGKTTALLAGFILAFLPGEFLGRSTIGYTDQHIAEVLFSTTVLAFLIYALNAAKSRASSLTQLKSQKSFYICSILAGISLGVYLLTWPGSAMLFVGPIFIFFVLQLIVDHFKNTDAKYLMTLISLFYLSSAITIAPYITLHKHFLGYGSFFFWFFIQITFVVAFAVLFFLHRALKNKKMSYPSLFLLLTALSAMTAFALYEFSPKTITYIWAHAKILFQTNALSNTTGELRPTIFNAKGELVFRPIWHQFFWTLPLAAIGFGGLVYRLYKNLKPADLLFFIWTMIIGIAAAIKIRFNYYFAINIAVLAGLGIYLILSLICYFKPQKRPLIILQKSVLYSMFFVFVFFTTAPITTIGLLNKMSHSKNVTHTELKTYQWLKKHTPKPLENVDYNTGLYPVPKSLPYDYPKNAYGIMAWWDYGYKLNYIAHRIPIATPSQGEPAVKAAKFFVSTSEDQAIKNLLGARYVMATNNVASNWFNAIAIRAGDTKDWTKNVTLQTQTDNKTIHLNKIPVDSPKFLNSMTNRLFYDDTNGLQHFRLIHESDGDYLVRTTNLTLTPTHRAIAETIQFKSYDEAIKQAKKINAILLDKDKTSFAYDARPPVKEYKIFEHVKGAVIDGRAPNIANDELVKLSLKLKTKYDRIFNYTQETKLKNGKYQFIVPYPTEAMRGDEYDYDITPVGKYQIKIKNKTVRVFVPEKAVMEGKTINV